MDPLRFVPKITNLKSLAALEGQAMPNLARGYEYRPGSLRSLVQADFAKNAKVENEARNFLEAREGTNNVSDASVREFLGMGKHGRLATGTGQVTAGQVQIRNLLESGLGDDLQIAKRMYVGMPTGHDGIIPRASSELPSGRTGSLGAIEPGEMGDILRQAWKNAGV